MIKTHCKYDQLVDPQTLKNHPKNRNKHGQDQIERLAELYEYQGIRHPIVVSKLSGFIVAGHGRKLAAIRAGIKEMPVVYQDFESSEQEYAFIQADNAIALWAELDMAGINEDMGDLGPDFDINMLGIQDFTIDVADKFEDKDADEIPEEVEPIAKLGQIYKLGEHRLMCGDSTDEATVSQLMNGEKADMVFTDPPYNHASDDKGVAAGVSKSHKKLMDSEWDKDFSFLNVANSFLSAMAPDCTIYVCTSHHLVGEILQWMKTSLKFSGLCIWNKPNPMPSLMKRHWTWNQELVCYGTNGKHTFNFPESGHATSVWTFNKKSDGTHPTQKPIELCEHAIKHSSLKSHSVLDLFGGSGSTLIACEKTNRKCFMMELDPHYVDVIIARWEKFTGKKVKAAAGRARKALQEVAKLVKARRKEITEEKAALSVK